MTQVVIIQNDLAMLFHATDTDAEQIGQFKVQANITPERAVRLAYELSSLLSLKKSTAKRVGNPVPVVTAASVDPTRQKRKRISASGVSRHDVLAWAEHFSKPFILSNLTAKFPNLPREHARNRIQALVSGQKLRALGKGVYCLFDYEVPLASVDVTQELLDLATG